MTDALPFAVEDTPGPTCHLTGREPTPPEPPRCALCRKASGQVEYLYAGPDVFICSECIATLSLQMATDRARTARTCTTCAHCVAGSCEVWPYVTSLRAADCRTYEERR